MVSSVRFWVIQQASKSKKRACRAKNHVYIISTIHSAVPTIGGNIARILSLVGTFKLNFVYPSTALLVRD
jgi:hypothetical protein